MEAAAYAITRPSCVVHPPGRDTWNILEPSSQKCLVVGGFNPSEKYASQIE